MALLVVPKIYIFHIIWPSPHFEMLPAELKFEKCCEAKKDAQGPYEWAQKKFQSEKN